MKLISFRYIFSFDDAIPQYPISYCASSIKVQTLIQTLIYFRAHVILASLLKQDLTRMVVKCMLIPRWQQVCLSHYHGLTRLFQLKTTDFENLVFVLGMFNV